jgi:hypothetical protein
MFILFHNGMTDYCSVVGIATGCEPDDRGIGVRVPVGLHVARQALGYTRLPI